MYPWQKITSPGPPLIGAMNSKLNMMWLSTVGTITGLMCFMWLQAKITPAFLLSSLKGHISTSAAMSMEIMTTVKSTTMSWTQTITLKYLKTKTQVEKLFTASRSMEKPFLRLWTQTHSSSKMPNFIWVIPGILHLEPLARFQTSRSMPIWLNEYVDCPTFFPFCFFMNIQIGCFYIQLRVCT